MADEEKDDDPLRFKFPKWFGPVLGTGVVVVGGMIANNHNTSIKAERDIAYLVKAVDEIREDQKRNRADIDKLQETSVTVQKKLLEGVDELIERERRKGRK